MNGAEPQRKPGAEDNLPRHAAGEAIAMCFSGVSLKQPVPAQAYRFGGS